MSVFVLAPIRGITDVVYRDVFARCFAGFDRAIAPFITEQRGSGLLPYDREQLRLDRNQQLPMIPQVHTKHVPTFRRLLEELHELGHKEVNWNLGCPHPVVARRGRGAGLLPHPDRIDAILKEVLADCPVALSVKLRLGNRNADEYTAVLQVLNRYPLAEVILHARTAEQMYGGNVDLDRAAKAFALCRHPFVYNGDITGPTGFAVIRERLPAANRWMIGRGALKDPLLPELLRAGKSVAADERRRRLQAFHDELFAQYRRRLTHDGAALGKLKDHWTYLLAFFADPKPVWRRVRRSNDVDTYLRSTRWAFEQELARPCP